MPEDLMRYDQLARNALRGVVRAALEHVAENGLPGEHHFYIAFDTHGEGVQISSRLLEKYPREMTIVLQHQFWELEVLEDRFSIGLSFNNIPEKLIVPYKAINSFFDPHVQFGLQFEADEDTASEDTVTPPQKEPEPEPEKAQPETDTTKEGDVVSLDAFRKK